MLQTLDFVISLGMIFLILSMAHKYIMSFFKRFFKIKPNIIAKEMKIFLGMKTSEVITRYIEKIEPSLNLIV